MGNTNIVDQLKNNAVFQLSLSSKELFHSNFLYWLSMLPQEEFKSLIVKLAGKDIDWPSDYIVLREEKNYDLCIRKVEKDDNGDTKETEYVFALENKVKSIITKKQLDGYHDEIEKSNNKYNKKNPRECAYCLLTLATEIPEKDDIKKSGWNIVSYADYAKFLTETFLQNGALADVQKMLVEQYRDYITIISDASFFNLPNIKKSTWSSMSQDSELENIRIDDLRQKMAFNLVGLGIIDELRQRDITIEINLADKEIWKKESGIFLNFGFANKRGMLYLSFLVDKNTMIRFEIQGDDYKRGIIFKEKASGKTKAEKKKEKNHEWLNKEYWKMLPDTIKNLFRTPDEDNLTKPYPAFVKDEWLQKKVLFGTYDSVNLMKYQSKKINSDSKIADVITGIVDELKDTVKKDNISNDKGTIKGN